MFIFSTNKAAAEEVAQWVPLEQKVVKDVCRFNSSTFFVTQIFLSKICIASYIHTSLYNTVLITKHIFSFLYVLKKSGSGESTYVRHS